jgi:hypothetical protein
MREIDDGGLAETLKKLANEIEELKYPLSVAHEMLDKLQDTAYAVLEVWDRHGFGYDLAEPIEVMRQQLGQGREGYA